MILSDKNIPFIFEALNSKCPTIVVPANEINNYILKNNSINHLFIRSTVKVNKDLLLGTGVVFIATSTSGIDHLDIDYLLSNNIAYFSAPGSNANSVAEYVVYSILKWQNEIKCNLNKKRIGIIGYGNIGKLVAEYSNALGLEVWVNDPPLFNFGAEFPEFVKYKELEEIFENCDIITNHVPLTLTGKYSTYKLLNQDLLMKLKENVLLIHTSRGGVLDENFLVEKIKQTRVFVAIDVWENEPDFNPFLVENALIATPHLAGYSYDGKLKGSLQVLKHFQNFTGIEPDYTVFDKEIEGLKLKSINDFESNTQVAQTILQNRKFEDDFVLFKQFSKLNIFERKKVFQEIRRNYPKRRECLTI
ncbi:MAG: NAD(P)-dependent oxidoreductase [Candidatus Kapaibacteriota bacterium]